jgi:cytochrome c-type biogenesis protein
VTAPSIFAAFFAGLIAFASPCVLPLLPGFLAFMSGQLAKPGEIGIVRRPPVVVALAFVGGFTSVFVSLGVTASSLGGVLLLHRGLLERAAGGALIAMGVATLGIIRLPILSRDFRPRPRPPPGVAGSLLLGAAFALGWSPCIGPTLAAVLAVAAGQSGEGPWHGAALLAAYSAGLGTPFIAMAAGMTRLRALIVTLNRRGTAVDAVSGLFLIAVGAMLATGQFASLSAEASRVP